MEYLQLIAENWGTVLGYVLAAMAGFDKVALVFIKTVANIRDAWRDSFPGNPYDPK
jgi:hypothetical protein